MKKAFVTVLLAALLIIILPGCATAPEIVTNEVKVNVPVPCQIAVPDKPVMPLDGVSPTEGDIFVITQSALAEIELRKGYEGKLEAVITSCNSEVTQVSPSVSTGK